MKSPRHHCRRAFFAPCLSTTLRLLSLELQQANLKTQLLDLGVLLRSRLCRLGCRLASLCLTLLNQRLDALTILNVEVFALDRGVLEGVALLAVIAHRVRIQSRMDEHTLLAKLALLAVLAENPNTLHVLLVLRLHSRRLRHRRIRHSRRRRHC